MIHQKTMAYQNERFRLNNLAKTDNMPDPNRFTLKFSVNPIYSVKKNFQNRKESVNVVQNRNLILDYN
jgi:hypothetical protein